MITEDRGSFAVENTALHPVAELAVTKDARIGSYLGVPVVLRDGRVFGTLCIAHHSPRTFTADDVEVMHKLARFMAVATDMQRIALVDELTSLYNRQAILSLMETDLARARRSQSSLTLFYLDLNGFKQVNDSAGHAVGDMVLKAAAARILEAVRRTDLVGRIGGDEFVVLLPETGVKEARTVETRLRSSFGDPFETEHATFRVGISIGAAEFPADGTTVADLVDCADTRMYADKEAIRQQGEETEAS